jgi:Asp-tRNA(Asn)/Glu-tRNA(Gln) amidotransferase C subunit
LAKLALVDIESGKINIHKLQSDLNAMIGYIEKVKHFDSSSSSNNNSDNHGLPLELNEFEPLHADVSQSPRDPTELLKQAPRVAKPYFHMPPRGNGTEV